jgi:RNA polymerase sigma factor (sigma-70 family)
VTSTEHIPTSGAATLADDLDAGFAALFDEHRQLVFSTALRVSGRWADAEDLTAEAFLRAYRALRGYSRSRIDDLRPRAWLVAILLNVWRNSLRSAARRPATTDLDQLGEPGEPADPGQDVGATAERRETGRELAALLGCLPADQRVAVVLRHVVDLPVAEIAQAMGCPQGTVRSHISRGLARLRELGSSAGAPPSPTSSRGAR